VGFVAKWGSTVEEQTSIDHVLDLDARGLRPRPVALEDVADLLLAERHRAPVGPTWPKAFIKRRSELGVGSVGGMTTGESSVRIPRLCKAGSGGYRT